MNQLGANITPLNEAPNRIKVEMSMWVPARVCNLKPDKGRDISFAGMERYNRAGSFCPEFKTLRPKGWTFAYPSASPAPNETGYLFAPFDPNNPPHTSKAAAGAFHCNDYVRVVGTLWEDQSHGFGGCWTASGERTSRGWVEIHPVDFMARIEAPPMSDKTPKPRSGVSFLSACSQDAAVTKEIDLVPVEPRPQHARIKVDRHIAPDWSNGKAATADVSRDRAHLAITVARLADGQPNLYHAAYSASWETCTGSCRDNACVSTTRRRLAGPARRPRPSLVACGSRYDGWRRVEVWSSSPLVRRRDGIISPHHVG